MPRPRKWRQVCSLPGSSRFGPLDSPSDSENAVNMTVDEYEAIRLIDLNGFTQEECGEQMNISRTTVQGIYNDARRKLAESLVDGKVLWIEGGEYRLCDGKGGGCGRTGCRWHGGDGVLTRDFGPRQINQKRRIEMRIAIPVDEKTLESGVCPSFGRAPYFLFYNTVTKESEYLDNSAVSSQGGAGVRAAQVIADQGVRALLTPRCGENAQEVLTKAEVLIYKTIPGTVRQNIEAFAADQLALLGDFHPGFHGHGQ